ncbi:TRAP dicarboxylate transporter DctQ subunit unknown substrate 6 [Paramagnetospirillum magnetotacticum MS-1]|uniref:TRAP transporter small permease protein n=1 Tax=Paramagnetospirillum magnetotacticum MS-1 TaxID=272627 RepID=A0A0C2V1Q9_PARME|nr:TRAP transporter small permease subunit [Paramagnetospirillum magnetotacticum]KIL99021.1 TRAP dicarboxylate transporter DctQ subunit unknown substrate 6 [Paramagnetospirillum magnetotacticum MS-1]
MKPLLSLSSLIDRINEWVGRTVYWLILVMVIVSSGNATFRYIFSNSSNAWLEVQWYLFATVFLLCAGYTLLRNEHIRIDVICGRLPRRTQIWIDIVGTIVFLFPMAMLILTLSWPMFMKSFTMMEMSSDAGGLIRWPVKLMIPLGFSLLMLQGASELIKKIAILTGDMADPGDHGHHHHTSADGEAV